VTELLHIADRIKAAPHWRVLLRPEVLHNAKLAHVDRCREVVERSQVRLRGWAFPLVHPDQENWELGTSWFGSSCDFMGHVQYWRFYQSTQFLFLAEIREHADEKWTKELRQASRGHADAGIAFARGEPPGYISLINLVYTITEYFEFATRLCEAGVYDEGLSVHIELNAAVGFVLTSDDPKWFFSSTMRVHSPAIAFHKTVEAPNLLQNSAALTVDAVCWFLERFGWKTPPRAAIEETRRQFVTQRA
jgi:hypothetical protein